LDIGDGNGGSASQLVAVTVTNVAPAIGTLTVPLAPVPLVASGTSVLINAVFTDLGQLDTHSGALACDGGTGSAVVVSSIGGSGTASGTCMLSAAGVYTVSLSVTDDDGGAATRTANTYIVIYDPSGGFVTGGGWIDSPLGAYSGNTSLTGRASFGFASKYHKGATTPAGSTEFHFHSASFAFHSDNYQWLVIAGAKTQFKGSGSITGRAGTFGFLVTAIDGEVAGGGGEDKFRMKIWDLVTNEIVYDNMRGQLDDSSAASVLGGGSISIKAK
jgi:hypothetical protein